MSGEVSIVRSPPPTGPTDEHLQSSPTVGVSSSDEVTAVVMLTAEIENGEEGSSLDPVGPEGVQMTMETEQMATEEGVSHVSQTPAPNISPHPSVQPTTMPRDFQTPLLPNLAQAAIKRLARTSRTVEDSPDDFQPLKKRKVQDVQEENDEEEEGQICSICFEPWSNSGNHRIASLKCGHLFGLNCIEKWLKSQGKCPQCNARAKKMDIRVIYAKAISVVDTTDRDRALKELEAEKSLRVSSQKAEVQAVMQHQLAKMECERLKQEIQQLRKQLECFQNPSSSSAAGGAFPEGVDPPSTLDRHGEYILQRTITVSQNGGSRVMAYDPHMGMVVASRPSNNLLMPGHGLMKMSTLELRYSEYVGVHSGNVRDVVFSPRGDGMVLTAGMDKSAKLTSMHSNTVVQCYPTPMPVWACAWNHDDPNYLYCGLQNGTVHVYDTRNTSGHVMQLTRPGGGACPITSLSFVPLCRASTLNCSGLLMGTLDGSIFWEKSFSSDSFTPHPLHPLPEGPCTCLSFEPVTRHCLASFRPSKRTPHSRHILCQLHSVPVDGPFCQPVYQFPGGAEHKLLSRSKLFQRPGCEDQILAAFGDEGTNSTHVWDVSTTSKLQQLSLSGDVALDIIPFGSSQQECLGILTNSKLFVYQWQWK